MEKKLNKKIELYVSNLKDDVRNKIIDLKFEEKQLINDLIEYVYEYPRLVLQKDDFVKRKRLKNSIPLLNRCNALRANGEQCTRRRRDDCEFCGTHFKGTPHGLVVCSDVKAETNKKMEVIASDIRGIMYYIDKYGNVYNTEDILQGKENPQVIAKYVKNGDKLSIPELNL
jgi:hypothetical protein